MHFSFHQVLSHYLYLTANSLSISVCCFRFSFISYLFFKFFSINFCFLYLKIKSNMSERFPPFLSRVILFLNCITPAFCSCSSSNFYWKIKQRTMLFHFRWLLIFRGKWFCLGLWFAHLKCGGWSERSELRQQLLRLVYIVSEVLSLNLPHSLSSRAPLISNFGILLFKTSRSLAWLSVKLHISQFSSDLMWTTYTVKWII